MQAWGTKIKQGRSAKIPDEIAALSEKIGVNSDTNMTIAGGSLGDGDHEPCRFGDDRLMFQNMPDLGR